MKTKFFDIFISEFNATGYEKAQGFNLENIKSLSSEEKKLAKEMLVTLMQKEDPAAPQALAAIGEDTSLLALQESLNNSRSPSLFHAKTAFAIWQVTHDDTIVMEIEKDLNADFHLDRLSVIALLKKINLQENTLQHLVEIAKHDDSPVVRGTAARCVLDGLRLIDDAKSEPSPYDEIIYGISSKDNKIFEKSISKFIDVIKNKLHM